MKTPTHREVTKLLMQWYEDRTFLSYDEALSKVINMAFKANRRKKPNDVKFR